MGCQIFSSTSFPALYLQPIPAILPLFPGLHPIPPQGGKLEIAGMVVGQWAGTRSARGRGSFGIQVVSVGGPGKGYVFQEVSMR